MHFVPTSEPIVHTSLAKVENGGAAQEAAAAAWATRFSAARQPLCSTARVYHRQEHVAGASQQTSNDRGIHCLTKVTSFTSVKPLKVSGQSACHRQHLCGTETEVAVLRTLSVVWIALLQAPAAGCFLQHLLKVLFAGTSNGKDSIQVLPCC